jgi:ABC-type uncharacterized transport system substrate-binding protein
LPIFDYGEKQMQSKFRIRFGFSWYDNRKSKIENRKLVGLLTIAVTFAMSGAVAQAQQPKMPKIGWLGIRPDSLTTSVESFRREFRALGYVEGKNFILAYRSADNKLDRLPGLADELIGLKVDLLITPSTNEARAAKNATKTIPIVFSSNDPVGFGLVNSLARPGGNLTGFSTIASELGGKRLELLKETITKLARVAFLWNPQTSRLSVERNPAAGKRPWLTAPFDGGKQRGQDRQRVHGSAESRECGPRCGAGSVN